MITVERDFDLTAFNTFGMKVKCACFVEYDRAEDLDTIFGGGMELPGPFLHIGGGSNRCLPATMPVRCFTRVSPRSGSVPSAPMWS